MKAQLEAFAAVVLSLMSGVALERYVLDEGDDGVVSVDCAAAHVTAEVVRFKWGGSTHGIPNRETDEFRDEVFVDAYEHLEEACGALNEPRGLWLAYEDLITGHQLEAIEHTNPEWLPWYQKTICPDVDEELGICTNEEDQ